jgi:hypothetical protein
VSVTRISFSASAKVAAVTGGPGGIEPAPGVAEKIEPLPVGVPASAPAASAAGTVPATATPAKAIAPSARNRLRVLSAISISSAESSVQLRTNQR